MDYIRCILKWEERLCGIGEDITEFQIAASLLSGLPECFHSPVAAFDTCPKSWTY